MATHSRGFVSSLLASSYAERVNSAAKLILTKGNTLLAEEEINMCTVLRMNRSFMEFMRKYHPDAAKQRFKMTVISHQTSPFSLLSSCFFQVQGRSDGDLKLFNY